MSQDVQFLNRQYETCIEACSSCAQICSACANDMIGMEHTGDMDMGLMRRCIRLCWDCADICSLAAQWMSRSSERSALICRLCADVCEQCAEVCERHAPQHPLCGPCAEECRHCAALCRDMPAPQAA